MTAAPTPPADEHARGLVFTTAAYLLWGAMPLYFVLLVPATAIEIVAHRVLWSLLVCLALSALVGRWRRRRGGLGMLATLRRLGTRSWLLLGLAGVLVAANWVIYVLAVNSGHVVEAALGYFINPVLSVVLGVVFLRERLSWARWLAVGISVVAVLVLAVGYGRPPWISLGLAASFGLYGLVKKTVPTDAVTSLSVETAWLTPVAAVTLLVLGPANTFAALGVGHALLLVSSGLATTIPLLFFGAGARRIPLSLVGLLQNLTPVMQFAMGVWLFHEAMPLVRWVGFALVWVALLVLMGDILARGRRRGLRRRESAAPEPTGA
ncbi:EamA family transporter RarD [Auraticoccus cholistanensis]|uniref:EamA family transporter RarD n=1 Tax=Auraticoccus cholistanensis TaxID=2656650 RepID=UPI002F915741